MTEVTTEDDLRWLYLEFGLTAETAQALECAVGNAAIAFLAFCVGPREISKDERMAFQGLMDDVNRTMLGKLLRSIQKSVEFDEATLTRLDSALERRNYLVHHFFRCHNFAIHSAEGRAQMLAELREIREVLAHAWALMEGLSSNLIQSSGRQVEMDANALVEKGRRVRI